MLVTPTCTETNQCSNKQQIIKVSCCATCEAKKQQRMSRENEAFSVFGYGKERHYCFFLKSLKTNLKHPKTIFK